MLRHWDQAQTPYQRLRATATLDHEQLPCLQALSERTNPLTLRKEMYRLLTYLWELPQAATRIA
ncbi:hypothetical protein EPA93_48120 [Ktedonosporobacter rubrisoli]|uniref:Uncharacterized protein n=1 Tax=Ktedonosporobacter rubrisoli TaxID=2509675 RepID=A0A4P6JHJ8_KTERU|nr:hypothetical protein [Ktedonosporobacter rubrisoli]QBD74477.1 hypothetical protein EPA93_00090 [Ktedonosporobacter rubrisoli]QBD83321.1 hypothetical protein EPA93_48120 [Ktedonosporobacter rubrisoli]